MLQVSENEVKNRFSFDNPWWETGKGIEARFEELPRRSYFELFQKLVSDLTVNRALILMGPRRVGKTVMIYHVIQDLLNKGKEGKKIIYLSLETPIYTGLSLEKILNLFHGIFNYKKDDELFIFFDEIQYLPQWEVHLKSLVDSYPTHKFIATGSAAAALRLKSRESGAGRFTDFMLPPLTFAEYLNFSKKEDSLIELVSPKGFLYRAKNIDALNIEFINYLNYGGYPEAVISKTVREDSSRFIKSDIIDKVLLRDLPSLYGINDIQELNRLFTTIAYNTGNEVSLEGLSQTSGVAKNTIKRYLEYLEAAFLIKRVNRIDDNARHFVRATCFKVYLTNPSMRSALFGYLDAESEAMGALTETAIFSQWLHSTHINNIYYARWKGGEVDLVSTEARSQKPVWCVEVKWSDRVVQDHSKIDGLINFLNKNKITAGNKNTFLPNKVTTKTINSNIKIKDIDIEFIPNSEMVYMIGKNILRRKITDGKNAPKTETSPGS